MTQVKRLTESGLGSRTEYVNSNVEIDLGRRGLGDKRVKKICTGLIPVAFQAPHLSLLLYCLHTLLDRFSS